MKIWPVLIELRVVNFSLNFGEVEVAYVIDHLIVTAQILADIRELGKYNHHHCK